MFDGNPTTASRSPQTHGEWKATAARIALSWEAGLVAILGLALFLRVYGMALQAWTPDTYEQLQAARRLADGEFPLSRIYPPGIAVTMAPFFVVFPSTLVTLQVVIIGASLALVVLAALAVRRATDDDLAAHVLALCLAAMPLFVYFSRDGLFDVVNTLWVVSAVLLVPALRKRGWFFAVWYGVALAIACTVRATNVILPSAVVVYWLAIERPSTLVDAARSLFSKPLLVAGATTLAVYAFLTYIGGWLGATGDANLGVNQLAYNLGFCFAFEFGGPVAAVVLVPLAVIGFTEVRRRNSALALVSAYMLVMWPLPYLLVPFANSRYMLPAFVFALIFAAHSPSAIGRFVRERRYGARHWRWPLYGVVAVVTIGFVGSDASMVMRWRERAARSDEGAYQMLRPTIADLPDGALLVSTAARGVQGSNSRIEYVDLIDYSTEHGSTRETVDSGVASISAAVRSGRPVYYLYSRLDSDGQNLGRGGQSFSAYFEGLDEEFAMQLVLDTSVRDFRLYRVAPDDEARMP